MKSKGLGDTIEKITTATGIKTVVKKISKDKLNKLFPYGKAN
jgi:hypothetical protein